MDQPHPGVQGVDEFDEDAWWGLDRFEWDGNGVWGQEDMDREPGWNLANMAALHHKFYENPAEPLLLDVVKRTAPVLRKRVETVCPGEDGPDISPLSLFKLFFEDSEILNLFLGRSNRHLAKLKEQSAGKEEMMDILMNVLEASLQNASLEEVYDDEMPNLEITRSVSLKRLRLLLRSLEGLDLQVVDADGYWKLSGARDPDISELERRMSKVSVRHLFVHSVTHISADDDHLRLRSGRGVANIGLSQKVNPRKAVGPVQTTMHDPVHGFWLTGRYATLGEGAEASLITCLMSLTDSSLPEQVHLDQGNLLSIDRGYLGPKMIDFLSQAKASWYGTHKTIASMPFAKEATKTKRGDARVVVPASGGRLEQWAKKGDMYALAHREAKSSSVATLATNVPFLGPGIHGMVMSRRAQAWETQQSAAVERAEVKMVEDALKRSVQLTSGQSVDCIWFLLRILHVTSTTAHPFLSCASKSGLLEGGLEESVAVALGIPLRRLSDISAGLAQVPPLPDLKKMTKKELVDVAKSINLTSDSFKSSESTVHSVARAVHDARTRGEEGVLARAASSLNKCFIGQMNRKPIATTASMRAGLQNEPFIADHLDEFMRLSNAARITYIKRTGLHARSSDPRTEDVFFAASVDAVCCIEPLAPEESCTRATAAVEMKTASDRDWVHKEEEFSRDHGRVVRCVLSIADDLSNDHPSQAGKLVPFKIAVRDPAHRCQIIQHAAALSIPRVLFVIATKSRIIRATDVFVSSQFLEGYMSCVKRLRRAHLDWTMRPPIQYPSFSAEELGYTKSNSDLRALCRLALDLMEKVHEDGSALPACHYLRPALICLWNRAGKLGTDVYSMFLSHVKLRAAKLSPGTVIFVRGMMTMVLNSYLLDRALRGGELLISGEVRTFSEWRSRAAAESGSFRKFVSRLTSEYFQFGPRHRASPDQSPANSSGQRASDNCPSPPGSISAPLVPASAFSRSKLKTRALYKSRGSEAGRIRLDKNPGHTPIIHKASRRSFCALCTINTYGIGKTGNRRTGRRHGPQVRYVCARCPNAVYLCTEKRGSAKKTCFQKWHSQQTLSFPSTRLDAPSQSAASPSSPEEAAASPSPPEEAAALPAATSPSDATVGPSSESDDHLLVLPGRKRFRRVTAALAQAPHEQPAARRSGPASAVQHQCCIGQTCLLKAQAPTHVCLACRQPLHNLCGQSVLREKATDGVHFCSVQCLEEQSN